MSRGIACLACGALVASCGRRSFDGHDSDAHAIDAPNASTVVTFGDLGDDAARVIATNRDGNLLVAGQFRGTVNFGCSALSSAGGTDGFIVELAPSLTCLRTWAVGGTSDDVVTD